MNARVPENEAERFQGMRRYLIVEPAPGGSFDHITALAAELFRVPIALISLVDHDRIWFKSRHGLDAQQIARDPGLCASAIFSPDVYHVRDGLSDPRTLANPLVAGEIGLRFYAAAPLRTHDNFNLGTLCIIDWEPRDLAQAERTMLAKLASVVMDQIELRRAAMKIAELEESERQMGQQLRRANGGPAPSEESVRAPFSEGPTTHVDEDIRYPFT